MAFPSSGLHTNGYSLARKLFFEIAGYKIDTLINKLVIVENKSVESLLPVHEAQLLTYMKLTGCKIGFLLNWNVPLMKHGVKRFILNLPGQTPYPKKSSLL